MLLKVLTVVGLASFEIYAAIPAGFAFNLSPLTIFLASATGGLLGLFVAAFLGDKIRKLFSKNKIQKDQKPKNGMLHKIWSKYGVIGVGLLGTMTMGAPASMAVGIGLNGSVQKLVLWCSIGIISRCVLFTTIGHFGNNLLETISIW